MFVKILTTLALCSLPLAAAAPSQASHLESLSQESKARSVASAIFYGALEKDQAYINELVCGMKAAEKGSSCLTNADVYATLMKYHEGRLSHQAVANLLASEQHFVEVSHDDTFDSIIPHEIYVKTLTPGRGSAVHENTESVKLRYRIRRLPASETGECLADTFIDVIPREHFLTDLIIGMRRGIIGMRPGEIRQMHIHPKWAYGSQSFIEPNLTLIATIELIASGGALTQPPLDEPLDCSPAELVPTAEAYTELKHNAAFGEGYIVWSHFKRLGALIDLDTTLAELHKLQSVDYDITDTDRATYGQLQAYLSSLSID